MTSYNSPQKEVTVVLSTLKTIAEAVIGAAQADTLPQVLQQIAYVAKQLVQTRYAALGVPGLGGNMAYFEVAGLIPEEIASISHPPVGAGLLGVIMHEREVLRLPDMQTDPRHIGFPENHPPMKSLLGVPIQVGGQLFGMLYLTDRVDGQPFTEEDMWLVESLAGYAALAIAGAQLKDQHSRLTLLEERERVGMELHDGIIQSLYAIGMQLHLLRLSQPTASEAVSKATRDLDSVIGDIRRYIQNLKVANYEQTSLRGALLDVIARLHVPKSLVLTQDVPERSTTLTPVLVEAICQIAYEAISNIVRHAKASRATIIISETNDAFTMVVEDNGRGFAPDAMGDNVGLGLRNILQRARIHGGNVTVNSAPGRGTRVTLILPM